MSRTSRAARRRSRFAPLTRASRVLPTAIAAVGALVASNHSALAASQTYTGTGLFSTGFSAGPAVNGNTVIFGGALPMIVNNDQTGLTLGAGTSTSGTNPYYGTGSYLGDAIDFTSATGYTLNGNAISMNGNIVNSGGATQTINFAMVMNGTTSPPYGYVIDTGTGNVVLGAALNNSTTFHDLIKIGTGALSFNATGSYIGAFLTNQGTVNINSTVNVPYFMSQDQTGGLLSTYNIGSGGSLINGGYVGVGATNTQNWNITGTGNLSVGSDLNVSDVAGSTGTMTIADSATVAAKTLYVGKGSNTAGQAVTTGTLNQTGGSLTNLAGPGEWRIGGANGTNDANSVGVYNMSGGTLTTSANFQVGAYGVGTMTQTGGSVTLSGYVDSGRFAGGSGNITVSGGTFSQTNTGTRLFVGETGTGVLTINGSGVVNSVGGVVIGNDAGSVGTLNLNTGGTLNTAFVSGNYNAGGGNTAGTATFNFNGGKLTPTASTVNFMSGLTNARILAGGATVNTSGYNVTIAQVLSNGGGTDGGLYKSGVGTLTLTGANTYNGGTIVGNQGTLIAGTSSALGTGTVKFAGGTLSATTGTNVSTGALSLIGNYTDYLDFGSGSTTTFTFANSSAQTFNGTLDLLNYSSALGDTLTVTGAGLTPAQLANIYFINPNGNTGTYRATFSGSNVVVGAQAAPEPGAVALLALGTLPLGAGILRRRKR